MRNLNVKTSGAAPAETIEKTAQEIADAIKCEINGKPAREEHYSIITQEFVDRHDLKATYHSGTFLGFEVPDSMIDEYQELTKR